MERSAGCRPLPTSGVCPRAEHWAHGPTHPIFPAPPRSCLSLPNVGQDQGKKLEMMDNPDSEGTIISINIADIVSFGREQDSWSSLADWILLCQPSSPCRVLSAHWTRWKVSLYCLHIIFGSVTYHVFPVLHCKKVMVIYHAI